MAALSTPDLHTQYKTNARAQVEKMKNDYWAMLLADNGGTVQPGMQAQFRGYCNSIQGLLEKFFADMDAIQEAAADLAATQEAIHEALVAGNLDEASRLYYRWSERNFARTGQVAGVQYVSPPSH